MPLPHRALLGNLLVIAAMSSAGCNGDRPPIVWTGEHIEVGTDLDLGAWCPGTLPRIDSEVGVLKDLFQAPEDHLVTYYVYPLPLSDYGLCDGNIFGCARESTVFSSELLLTHELVHAVSWAHGYMPPFFEEGAASYWGEGGGKPWADFRGLDIREVLDNNWKTGLAAPEYALAAHFTSYMIHTHGIEPYVALMRATSWGQSRWGFERAFEDALGLTLDDAIDDYEEQWPYCDVRAMQRRFYECSQPATKLPKGETTSFDLDISCNDPDVVGPMTLGTSDGVPRIWRDITIELESRIQEITFEAPEFGEPNTVVMDIRRCNTQCDDVMVNTRQIKPTATNHLNRYRIDVSPGRYVVRVNRAADDPGPVRFRWQQGL